MINPEELTVGMQGFLNGKEVEILGETEDIIKLGTESGEFTFLSPKNEIDLLILSSITWRRKNEFKDKFPLGSLWNWRGFVVRVTDHDENCEEGFIVEIRFLDKVFYSMNSEYIHESYLNEFELYKGEKK